MTKVHICLSAIFAKENLTKVRIPSMAATNGLDLIKIPVDKDISLTDL